MKFATALLPLVFLAACGHSDNSTPAPSGSSLNAPGGQTQQTLKAVSTPADCVGGREATTVTGNWVTDFKSNNFVMHAHFNFDGQFLTLINVCDFSGQETSAQTEVPYQQTGTTISTMGSGHDDENNNGVECHVSVVAQAINYHFQGSCLVFADGQGNELYLHPAN